MINNKLLLSVVLLLATSLFLVACSDDKSTNEADNQSTTDENTVNNTNKSSDDIDSSDNGKDDESSEENNEEEKDEHIEHQYGLGIGETGTVVSYSSNNLDDSIRYEVTLNEMSYDENIDLKIFNGVYVVVDVTIKNIDDKPIDLSEIFAPGLGELGTTVFYVPVKSEFVQDFSGITILEGELEPGESKTGNYVFDVPKADNYKFAFGKTSDQIVTLAEWELSAEEIK
jgi:hypothetical protein